MRNIFLSIFLVFTIAVAPIEYYELLQPDEIFIAGQTIELSGVWNNDEAWRYDRIVCATFDGYSWSEFQCFSQVIGYTQVVYTVSYQTSINDKIIDIAIGSSQSGIAPLVRRLYIDNGLLAMSLYGVDWLQSGYVSPYYAQLINMSFGFGAMPEGLNPDVPIVTDNGLFDGLPDIPNPFNAFADSFNNWRSWIDGNFLSKLQFDTSALNDLKPWLLFFAAIMGTVSPVIPVPLLVTVTALVAVITNLTIILSIYDRIRKLLI
jgi:hypothetical protein